MHWSLNLSEELGQLGHQHRFCAEPHKQMHDRRDADLILKLMVENRFPAIWMPSPELSDLHY
jgi:hypothetical protein